MKITLYIATLLCLLLLASCNSDPSLQKYFVEKTENKNFVALDVSSSIINIDKSKLTVAQSEALQSFDKMNVLAFKLNDKNKAEFEVERTNIKSILGQEKYQQLMKFGSGKEGAAVSFVGTDEHIEEFVLYGSKNDNGFVVVRVLGKDMNPTHIMNMIGVLQQANIDLEQLKPLQDLLKK